MLRPLSSLPLLLPPHHHPLFILPILPFPSFPPLFSSRTRDHYSGLLIGSDYPFHPPSSSYAFMRLFLYVFASISVPVHHSRTRRVLGFASFVFSVLLVPLFSNLLSICPLLLLLCFADECSQQAKVVLVSLLHFFSISFDLDLSFLSSTIEMTPTASSWKTSGQPGRGILA